MWFRWVVVALRRAHVRSVAWAAAFPITVPIAVAFKQLVTINIGAGSHALVVVNTTAAACHARVRRGGERGNGILVVAMARGKLVQFMAPAAAVGERGTVEGVLLGLRLLLDVGVLGVVYWRRGVAAAGARGRALVRRARVLHVRARVNLGVSAMGMGILLDRGEMLHELQLSRLGTTCGTASVGKGAWGQGRVHGCAPAVLAYISAVCADVFWGSAVDVVRRDWMVLLRGVVLHSGTWMDGRKGMAIPHFWRRRHLLQALIKHPFLGVNIAVKTI